LRSHIIKRIKENNPRRVKPVGKENPFPLSAVFAAPLAKRLDNRAEIKHIFRESQVENREQNHQENGQTPNLVGKHFIRFIRA
jgi:hypothetical protein